MFSLDKFYQILHDNLISKYKNSHTFYFTPFGTYDEYMYVQNKHDQRLHTDIGSFAGAMMQTPSDASVDEVNAGDLETARKYGERIAMFTKKMTAAVRS